MSRSNIGSGTRWGIGAVSLAFLAAAGCSSAGGLNPFPEGHKMIDAAKEVRNTSVAPLPRELDKRPLDTYTVEPGDGLLVLPAELDSPIRLPSDQPVLPDGTIDLGKYGRHQVMGRTTAEIERIVNDAVAAKLKEEAKGKEPAAGAPAPTGVTVRLVNRVSKVYYVLGEVTTPGSFPLQGRETVLDGIVAAGGLNAKSSRKNIILVRPSAPEGCRTVLAVCYPEIVQLGDTSTNYQLRPGDRIYVSTKGFREGLDECLHNAPPCVTCAGPHAACGVGSCAAPAQAPAMVFAPEALPEAKPNPAPLPIPR